jgi:hypothetical protein
MFKQLAESGWYNLQSVMQTNLLIVCHFKTTRFLGIYLKITAAVNEITVAIIVDLKAADDFA